MTQMITRKSSGRVSLALALAVAVALCLTLSALAQTAPVPPQRGGPPPGGPGGFPGMPEEKKIVKQFDKDGDKRLNAEERKAAREFLANEQAQGRGRRMGGFGFGGRGGNQAPPQPGPKLSPADVRSQGKAPLYDLSTLRTLFLEFEQADWEKELADFYNTDVEVPATLTVDGKTYKDVGVHFRGASSFFTVSEGRKRSLNLALDFVHPKQQLGGYRTLNLLNSHTDASFLRTVLYYQVVREYIPAPKANYVRVVINGESWGVYVNAQQFNRDFVKDWFRTTEGARWKVPGSPMGRGGLSYLGDEAAPYKRIYEIKSQDDPQSWAALIKLCKVLNETPADKLEAALAPLLDIDAALKFLALENALINSDGYWIRSSDYNLYRDEKGRFHIIPHDANETFRAPGGPGFGRGGPGGAGPGGPGRGFGGPRINGVELNPLMGADDPNKPLLSKLLAVPELRARYLGYVRDIAEKWLDWKRLGPLAAQYQALITADVQADTRKLDSFEAFQSSLQSLKSFAEERRAYLLNHPEIKKAGVR